MVTNPQRINSSELCSFILFLASFSSLVWFYSTFPVYSSSSSRELFSASTGCWHISRNFIRWKHIMSWACYGIIRPPGGQKQMNAALRCSAKQNKHYPPFLFSLYPSLSFAIRQIMYCYRRCQITVSHVNTYYESKYYLYITYISINWCTKRIYSQQNMTHVSQFFFAPSV